jgi:TRAP-type mannitol/chloroaromatic compound transport system permease large subunit
VDPVHFGMIMMVNLGIGLITPPVGGVLFVGSAVAKLPPALPPLEGYTFEGYRNADGSVGTRNILAITTTVQCVAGVVDFAVQRIKAELLPAVSECGRRGGPGAHLRLRRGH